MISIVIIVKNDPRLAKLLAMLQKISYPEKTEIIVVDASMGKLDEIKNTYPKIQWIYYRPKFQKRTYAEQRNLGILASKGDVIVFIDADCFPEKDWLINVTQPILEGKEKIVSGACRPLIKNFIHKEEQYGAYREECETMNMALAKDVFAKVGLFDETLEGCEDSDFCIRARKKGFRIRYVKQAIIYHDWGGIINNLLRSYNGGRDRVKLYAKHLKHLSVLTPNNIYTLYYVIYVIFLPVAFFYPGYIFIVFIPSLIKRRNPLKELFNISFAVGVLKQLGQGIVTKKL